ncbi:MAG: hypothetical protein ACTTIA_02530 [Candidatus Cryptobacteroides sp.]
MAKQNNQEITPKENIQETAQLEQPVSKDSSESPAEESPNSEQSGNHKEKKNTKDKASKNGKDLTEDNVEEQSEIEKEAERIFAENESISHVFMTSDGFGYVRYHDAYQHSLTLEDKKIKFYKRK